MNFKLPELQYEFNALEPHIDTKTMEIHYGKHHQTYIDNLNRIMEKYQNFADQKLEVLMENIETMGIDEKDRQGFINNGGGHLNHSFFWKIMGPKKEIDGKLKSEITETYGSVEDFKTQFKQAALSRFGSGWVWLVKLKTGSLELYSTPNQDSPYLKGHTPVIGLDVWEHAYYLKYQNKRADYIDAWWKVLKLI